MKKEAEEFSVKIDEQSSITAMLYPAPNKNRAGVTIILGHGAGANQLSGFMRQFAAGLAERGCDVLTFNFLYMEQGRHVPDKNPKLEECFRAVIEAAAGYKKLKGNRIAIGGKSMGGRIASQVAAASSSEAATVAKNALPHGRATAPISALVLLGYPLHPPGRLDKLRDAHLASIRDAFGSDDELRSTIKKHRLPATLHIIEGGDHSFKVPKSSGLTQSQVYESVMDEIAIWLRNKSV
jgi:uncharacterized protein